MAGQHGMPIACLLTRFYHAQHDFFGSKRHPTGPLGCVCGFSVLRFLWNVFCSLWYDEPVAVDDPWSPAAPPPRHNFTELPRIRFERPAFCCTTRRRPSAFPAPSKSPPVLSRPRGGWPSSRRTTQRGSTTPQPTPQRRGPLRSGQRRALRRVTASGTVPASFQVRSS